ncbi:MAG: GTP-dependent dephospho-CoA kinase family protein [Nitrososphaeria archaeon]
MHVWLLTEDISKKLKAPLGLLIQNSEDKASKIFSSLPECGLIVSVGDATLDYLLSINVIPDIQIVDSREKRVERAQPKPAHTTTLYVKNPRGTLSDESVDTYKKALSSTKPVRVIVEGEEDLLTLLAIIMSPANSCIFYGQPQEGLVLVKVENEVRSYCQSILDSMIQLDMS